MTPNPNVSDLLARTKPRKDNMAKGKHESKQETIRKDQAMVIATLVGGQTRRQASDAPQFSSIKRH